MCGRFVLSSATDEVVERFGLGTAPALRPRYNITPQSGIPVVRVAAAGRECAFLRWGLVPFWSKEPKSAYSTINAKSKTVAGKPTFREAFKRRRCLIPANGFYEWKKVAGGKVPYFIHVTDAGLFAFAGLWERWEGKGEHAGLAIESCTVLTTVPNAVCAAVHDRMPVILDTADYARWLAEPAVDLLRPFPAERMEAYPVSRAVNVPANDGPGLLERSDA